MTRSQSLDEALAQVASPNMVRRRKYAEIAAEHPELIPHGTAGGYYDWGCKCDLCKERMRRDGKRRRNKEKRLAQEDATEAARLERRKEARRRSRVKARDKRTRMPFVEGAPHGTITGYTNWKCSCDECREAVRIYIRTRTAEKKDG